MSANTESRLALAPTHPGWLRSCPPEAFLGPCSLSHLFSELSQHWGGTWHMTQCGTSSLLPLPVPLRLPHLPCQTAHTSRVSYISPQDRAGLGTWHFWICGILWEKLYFWHIWWFLKCFVSLAGGKETQHDVWKYNSSINKWIQIEYLNIGRWRHKMVVLGGKVYVIGGFDGLQRINNVETYDPFHNCWSEV